MQGSAGAQAAYARSNFVSAATMAMIAGMRRQVLQELQVSLYVCYTATEARQMPALLSLSQAARCLNRGQ